MTGECARFLFRLSTATVTMLRNTVSVDRVAGGAANRAASRPLRRKASCFERLASPLRGRPPMPNPGMCFAVCGAVMQRRETIPRLSSAGLVARRARSSRADYILHGISSSWRRGLRRALIAVALLLVARCTTTGPTIPGNLSSSACAPPLARAAAPAPDRVERRCLFLGDQRCDQETEAYTALHRKH
jgi:hypothetical protein